MSMDRKQLTEIIEAEQGNNWWKPDLFELKVKSSLPDELKIISGPPAPEENYNCFVYAFGMQNDQEFLGGKNPVQQEFIRWLISNKILVPTENGHTGDLVFYENEKDEITHSGIMRDGDSVISKWMWGPTIIHKLFDVPISFGDKISFFISPGTEQIKTQYLRYKNSGVRIKPIT